MKHTIFLTTRLLLLFVFTVAGCAASQLEDASSEPVQAMTSSAGGIAAAAPASESPERWEALTPFQGELDAPGPELVAQIQALAQLARTQPIEGSADELKRSMVRRSEVLTEIKRRVPLVCDAGPSSECVLAMGAYAASFEAFVVDVRAAEAPADLNAEQADMFRQQLAASMAPVEERVGQIWKACAEVAMSCVSPCALSDRALVQAKACADATR